MSETRPVAGGVPPGTAAAALQDGPAAGTRWLRYVGASSVTVRGPVTRRPYVFALTRAVQAVDLRDAYHLLRTGLFRAA